MLGIGGTELAIILLFGFLVFGPDKLPQMGRTIGRAIRQFRNAQEEMNKVVRAEVYDPLKDDEPLGDSFKDIFSEFTGDKKKEDKKAQAAKQDGASVVASAPESATSADVDAATGEVPATQASSTLPSEAASTVVKKEVNGETFAEKKARLAAERAAKKKAHAEKGAAAADSEPSVADKLYGLDKGSEDHEDSGKGDE